MSDPQILVKVRGLSKKFSTDIKYNMYYGLLDLLGGRSARERLRKKEFWALQQLDFELREGEILGVVGSNGSGKTTLMRLLAGIYDYDVGDIRVRQGSQVKALFALRSGMQALFSGRENIYIKGAMYGMDREQIQTAMTFIEDFSELGDRLDRPFGNYSSGMKARLAYSIALAAEPDIFIVDEALAVGDTAFKAKCFDHLETFVQQPGKAVIFVSNHTRKVLRVATRVIVLDRGEMLLDSTNVKEALTFYINRCMGQQKRIDKLRKIQEFDLE